MADSSEYAALILAAGLSSRMGRDKASLPWLGGKSLLPWTLEVLRESGWSPLVVVGPHNQAFWESRLPGATVVMNPDPARGKTSSIAVGAAAAPKAARHLLLAGVDQPRPPAVYRLLREAADETRIVVPGDGKHRDHPIVIGARWRERLMHLDEQAQGLRGLMDAEQASLTRLPCPPEWLRWDCNTPQAYEEARAWFEKSAGQLLAGDAPTPAHPERR